ncbi:MAG: cytochrome c [Beijerinckiaceae bacterium]
MRFSLVAGLVCASLVAPGALALDKAQEQDLIVQCAACHGADGVARSADVPHIACQQEIYLYNQMQAFRSGKRPHKEMRFMGRHMTEADMRIIAEYYASLPCR